MKLIVCLDDRGGMAFNQRRQSRDRALIADVLRTAKDSQLYLTPYSFPLFEEQLPLGNRNPIVTETPAAACPPNGYCFWELTSPESLENVDELIVYRWNRHYPADVHFSLPTEDFTPMESYDFKGSSHEKITRERWIRRGKDC